MALGSSCYVVLEPVCGDGIVNQPQEACDAGVNNAPDAACTSQCTVAVCGDGHIWTRHLPVGMSREECDDGVDNADDAACLPSCVRARCGDGLVWQRPLVSGSPPESCDDGNTRGGDGCGPACQAPVERALGSLGVQYVGEPDDIVGSHVSSAGDVDDDDFDDLILGAPGSDAGGPDAGAAYVLFGATEPLDLAKARVQLVGERGGDQAGVSVAAAGDFNGDGVGDVIIGAPLHDDGGLDAGAAYVVLGPVVTSASLADADLKLVGEAPGDWAGWSVAGVGDVDDDGFDDVLVGAPGSPDELRAGAAYLVRGRPIKPGLTLDLGKADATLTGEAAGDRLGLRVAGAGNLNGDDFDDLIVVAPLHDEAGNDAGAAYVVSGPVIGSVPVGTATAKLLPEGPGAQVGSVSAAGDVDGDGVGDVVVGSEQHDARGDSTGKVYVLSGPLVGSVDLASSAAAFVGPFAGSRAGHSVAAAGDVNRDGFADLLVGAPGVTVGPDDEVGAAYLIFGPVGGQQGLELADVQLLGGSPGDMAGTAVAAAGDVDGDGLPDLLVGASGHNAAYLVLGGMLP